MDDSMTPFSRFGATTTLKMDSGPLAPERPSPTALSPASKAAPVLFWTLSFLLDALVFFWTRPKRNVSYMVGSYLLAAQSLQRN